MIDLIRKRCATALHLLSMAAVFACNSPDAEDDGSTNSNSTNSQDTSVTNDDTASSTFTASQSESSGTTQSTTSSSDSATTSNHTFSDASTSASETSDIAGEISDLVATDEDCKAIYPFYWEVGDAQSVVASGSAGEGGPTRDTQMLIASASKWPFAAAVIEARGGALSAGDIEKLHFTSAFHSFETCLPLPRETVKSCLERGENGVQSPDDVGRFYYNGGHMQALAVELGFGDFTSSELADRLNHLLATSVKLDFVQPQPAGGISWTAAGYAEFLRKQIRNELAIGAMLGTHEVCTNRLQKGCSALYTPIPLTEAWGYSLGHWVESDPQLGDQSVSSAGMFGFYPWIDASREFYGMIAREDRENERAGYNSALCGRKIRKLWLRRR